MEAASREIEKENRDNRKSLRLRYYRARCDGEMRARGFCTAPRSVVAVRRRDDDVEDGAPAICDVSLPVPMPVYTIMYFAQANVCLREKACRGKPFEAPPRVSGPGSAYIRCPAPAPRPPCRASSCVPYFLSFAFSPSPSPPRLPLKPRLSFSAYRRILDTVITLYCIDLN